MVKMYGVCKYRCEWKEGVVEKGMGEDEGRRVKVWLMK